MHFSEKAQSMIEYAVVIILVAAGIILGGPYVIRGVNAHFKLWEDAVNDSQEEAIQQADVSELPQLDCGDCSRQYWIRPGCCSRCGDSCNNGFCCSERGENIPSSPNYCPEDCGGGCIGITEAICNNRSESTCCTGDCCSNCRDQADNWINCVAWRGACDVECAFCGNGIPEAGETPINCCQDAGTCGDGICCTVSAPGHPAENQNNCIPDCCNSNSHSDGICNCGETHCTYPSECPCAANACNNSQTCVFIGQCGPPCCCYCGGNMGYQCLPGAGNPCAGVNCDNWDNDSGGCGNQCNPNHCCTRCSIGGGYTGCTTYFDDHQGQDCWVIPYNCR
ncbi:MAG TPA: hypothetical protein PL155_02645 [Candidatus Omnitrophota bacterium]|nr:hypothetical protein [Candidatus Omnitrophota bacterium]HPD84615.1 hypothetical protein [Candidatus Omnitrophota bacterium]HRZ03473.1 hypothetical protein [Candidatus Omnitrophota bacterium]